MIYYFSLIDFKFLKYTLHNFDLLVGSIHLFTKFLGLDKPRKVKIISWIKLIQSLKLLGLQTIYTLNMLRISFLLKDEFGRECEDELV